MPERLIRFPDVRGETSSAPVEDGVSEAFGWLIATAVVALVAVVALAWLL
jgi:hypothetical protein